MKKPTKVLNSAVAKLLTAADNTYSDELLMAAYKAGAAHELRRASTALRKRASKLRSVPVVDDALPLLRARSNELDSLADKFLHEAQALEKEQ